MTHLLDIPSHIWATHPALRSHEKSALAATCKTLRRGVLGSCTSVLVCRPPKDGKELRDMVAQLRHLSTLGLSLHKLSILHPKEAENEPTSDVTDLSPLSELTGLQHLDCRSLRNVTDLSPLTALTGLRHLNCAFNDKVTDLSPLTALTGLQHLEFGWLKNVTDLSPLTALTGLRHLNCSYLWNVTDLSPLTTLTGLQHLDCDSWVR